MRTQAAWLEGAASLQPDGALLIDGRRAPAASGATFEVRNPATGDLLAEVAAGDDSDVDRAVRAARTAFEDGVWSRAAPAERKRVMLRLSELVLENAAELALLNTCSMGKLIRDAFEVEIPSAARVIQWYAEAVDKLYGEIAPTSTTELALISNEPLGVVGAVTPWNFPLGLVAWKVAPALSAGNSVVLKPAEQSPLAALRLAELALEAGIPAGVFNVVPGLGGVAGRGLGLHPDVDCIAFTGSTEVGKLFLRYAGESNMKQVWLECGGKSPNLVFADATDLDQAAKATAGGIFFNQGEVCSANSRLLVESSVKDEFLDLVLEHSKAFEPGDPLDPASSMGALVDRRHTERVLDFIEYGKGRWSLALGGERRSINGGDCFVEPTIFDQVSNEDRLAREEIFGPVLTVIPFSGEDAAIRFANESPFGLAASVWTQDLNRAHRLSRSLRAGIVSVNSVDNVAVEVPFGGFKESGTGRDLSLHAFDKYTGLKTCWFRAGE